MADQEVLAPLEAALHLGITAELLFAYVRHAPRKATGSSRRLIATEADGRLVFRRSELDDFDLFLREPWIEASEDRPAIPTYVVDYLKVESGGQCARCSAGFPIETAHITPYASSRSHHHHNLIRLCASCHTAHDAGVVPPEAIKQIKQRLVRKVQERIEAGLGRTLASWRSLPPPAPLFVGRERELRFLSDALGSSRVVSILGPGGIGKTQLLLRTLARCADPRQVIWIDVNSDLDSRALELGLLAALRSSGETSSASLAQALDSFGGYVVLDGVEQADGASQQSVEDVASALIATTRSVRFVLTSQTNLVDLPVDHALLLDGLESEAGRSVLRQSWTPPPATADEGPALAELERFADGHPLTLRLLNALLRFYGSGATVRERIFDLGAGAIAHPVRRPLDRLSSLEKCLRVAYQLLDTDARRLLFVISHCPAGALLPMMSREEFQITDVSTAVASVRRWNLLVTEWQASVERIRLLAPVAAFVRQEFERADPTGADSLVLELARNLSVQAAVIDYRYMQRDDVAGGKARFDQELPNLLHVLKEAEVRSRHSVAYDECIACIASGLHVFCFIVGDSAWAIEIMRLGMQASDRLKDWSAMSLTAVHLLTHAIRLEERSTRDEAIDALRRCATSSAEHHTVVRRLLGESAVASDEGDLSQALAWGELAVAHCRSRCEKEGCSDVSERDDGQSLALALMTTGRALEAMKRPRDALSAYAESLDLMRRFEDDVNLGAVLHQMGNCHGHLRQPDRAAECYVQAAEFFSARGFFEFIGNALSELGYLLLKNERVCNGVRELVAFESLVMAGEEVVSGARRAYLGPADDSAVPSRAVALRRLFGWCVLASLMRCEGALLHLCDTVRQDVVAALVPTLPTRETAIAEGPSEHMNSVILLDMMMAMAGSLAMIARRKSDRPSLQAAGATASLCFPLGTWIAMLYPTYEWLAMYLRRCHGVGGFSVKNLVEAVEELHAGHGDFDLPAFRHRFDA